MPAAALEVFLRAEATTVTMPDGRVIPMWGFAQDSAFGANDGVVTVPGPMIVVPSDDPTLIIHVDNNLTEPVSIVIPGQTAVMTPVFQGPEAPGVFQGRVISFTHETPPGNTTPVTYTFENFRVGSFIYHSGYHVAYHVQMGLYGGIKKDQAEGTAYTGVDYDNEITIFYSEIDADFHDRLAAIGTRAVNRSPLSFKPQYYLINGQPFDADTSVPIPAGSVGQSTLIRFYNAGMDTRTPLLQGMYMMAYAEDGNLYPYPKEQYSLGLVAAQTMDVVINATTAGTYPLYDRGLRLTTASVTNGGLFTSLLVAP